MTASQSILRRSADGRRVPMGLAASVVLALVIVGCSASPARPPTGTPTEPSPLATAISPVDSSATPAVTAGPATPVAPSPGGTPSAGSSFVCPNAPRSAVVDAPPRLLLGIDDDEEHGQLQFQDWSGGNVGGSITGSTDLPDSMGTLHAGAILRLVTDPPVRINSVRATAVLVEERDRTPGQQASRTLLADYSGSSTAVCFAGPGVSGDWEVTVAVTFGDGAGQGSYAWRWSFE